MVIDLVEYLGQIYGTKIRCTAFFGKVLYNIMDNTNSKVASESLFLTWTDCLLYRRKIQSGLKYNVRKLSIG